MPHDVRDSASPDGALESAFNRAGDTAVSQPDSRGNRSWLEPPLSAITRVALRFPVATLALAVGLAGLCVLYAITHLGYRSSRLALLNPKSDYNRRWIEYVNEFGDEDDAVIVVEGSGPEVISPVLDELSVALHREPRLFHAILDQVDFSKIGTKGLQLDRTPIEFVQQIEQFLQENLPMTRNWSQAQVASVIGRYLQMLQTVGASDGKSAEVLFALDSTVESLLAKFGSQPHYQSPWPELPRDLVTATQSHAEHFFANQGRMGFVLLRIAVNNEELARGTEAVDTLRELIADMEVRHPNVKIGLTGLPIMENDEMRSSQSSMTWGGALSFIGVVIVVVAGFGGLRHALLANLVLLIGGAWAFGYATLVVGHLNLLSITFTATLVGVGVDYGTYYVSRYMQLRRTGEECDAALRTTTRIAGPAIVTGAMTTVVAFFATGATSFTGIAELGIIAGGGILLCAVAQLFVLPPLVKVVDQSSLGKKFPQPVPVHSGIAALMRAPRVVMAVGVIVTVVAAFGLKRLWFDYNLLNLQPKRLESVDLEEKLLDECHESMWYAISVFDDSTKLLEFEKKFRQLPSVEKTEEIDSQLMCSDEAKRPLIARIAQQLANLPERSPLIAIDSLDELNSVLGQAQDVVMRLPDGKNCGRHLEQLREAMRQLPPAECFARLSQFQQEMASDLLSRLHVFKSVANPEPPQLSDLPESLVTRFVGKSGKHLLRIYGKGDIRDMDVLEKFVKDVRSVDPRVTGNPLQTFECSREMIRSYKYATLYSLIVIFGVLYFDFRNLRHCALAALPQFMGIAITFGLLGYLDLPLNPANLIAVPMILGIGVDYSVYIVHEYLEQKGRYRMSPGTAIAVTVDSLTTLIGYGSLLIASHRGLQSLGRVLTLAVTFCTLMSIVVLPAFLVWMTRKRPLVPWVGDAVESYDHDGAEEELSAALDSVAPPVSTTRRAA